MKLLNKLYNLPKKVYNRVRQSNGFMTKTGALFSKPETHAVSIGLSWLSMSFMLPTPLGELSFIVFLLMLRTGFKKWERDESMPGHIGDVMHEIGYTSGAAALTVYMFTEHTAYGLSSIDVVGAVTKILLGI